MCGHVNYFELHIGDYQRKTAHLSLAEHGAYTLMLQTFYASERPLPAERRVLYRLLRADSAGERKAIDSVLAQFWEKSPEGYTNKRAAEVVSEFRAWVEKQRSNGNRGGRPPKTHGLSVVKPNGKQNPNPDGSETGDSHLKPPTSHLPLPTPEDLSPHTHTPIPTSQVARRPSLREKLGAPDPLPPREPGLEQGSVCGTFTKIGGEKTHAIK